VLGAGNWKLKHECPLEAGIRVSNHPSGESYCRGTPVSLLGGAVPSVVK